jgi:hypothetical protein
MKAGMMDNFNSQEILNTFDDKKTNDINILSKNFLPSIEIKLIKNGFEEFTNHPSAEVFKDFGFNLDEDADTLRRPYLLLDKLNRYIRF